MTTSKIFPQTLAILAILAPILVTYNLWEMNPSSEKQLEVTNFGTSNILSRLNEIKGPLEFSLHYGKEEVENLYSTTSIITNPGKNPIRPSDFFEGISVSVDKRWRFLAVATTPSENGGAKLEWACV